MVEVILLKNSVLLGDIGKIVRVSSGYARNYLIPNHIALPVTSQLVKQFEHKKRLVQAKISKTRVGAQELVSKINTIKLLFVRHSSEQGKLFGSVTAVDISESLEQKGVQVDRRQVLLSDGPIKSAGEFKVDIRLFQDIKAQILVEVKGEADPAQPEKATTPSGVQVS